MGAAIVASIGGLPPGRASGGDSSATGSMAASVVASCTIPADTLAAATANEPAVILGGISDLCVEPLAAGLWRAWAVTDRGPNGQVTVGKRVHRTLAAPSFAPRIVEFTIDWTADEPARLAITPTRVTVLRDAAGEPLSGRPNGLAGDPDVVDPSGTRSIAADPDGVDTEGLVRTRSGEWWIAEEYRPSLLAAASAGTARLRLVPSGETLAGAGMEVRDALPKAYAGRRDNRGFEALAIAPDESRIFALLQSPLERPDRDTAERNGNVRLLAFDPLAGTTAAEHVYRLGDPGGRTRAHDHGPMEAKLCAMAALGPRSLVVLEQASGGVARLYRADLHAATDTLPRTQAGDDPPLESLADLSAAGIEPVKKTLLADLGPALERMRLQAGLRGDRGALKIEGLAIADERHVFLVNDNDFGIREDAGAADTRSCLWVVKVPAAMPLTSP